MAHERVMLMPPYGRGCAAALPRQGDGGRLARDRTGAHVKAPRDAASYRLAERMPAGEEGARVVAAPAPVSPPADIV